VESVKMCEGSFDKEKYTQKSSMDRYSHVVITAVDYFVITILTAY
jgi:hypothetical protein